MKNKKHRKIIVGLMITSLFVLTDSFFKHVLFAQSDYSELIKNLQGKEDLKGKEQDLLNQYKSRYQDTDRKKISAGEKAAVQSVAASQNAATDSNLSNIEEMYRERYGSSLQEPLKQYGYNIFDKKIDNNYISVSDDYRVGPGDTISIYFWGDPVDILNLNSFYVLEIDRNGKIFIPGIGVFYVWGLKTDEIKQVLNKAIKEKFKNFSIELALGDIRQFPVYVSGFIKTPGAVLVSAVHNILDVLSIAGGIGKNGSLRNVVIYRAEYKGTEKNNAGKINLDLYELLLRGKPLDYRIKQGDVIFIDVIKKTAGIVGGIKRPAVYELSGDSDTIKDLVDIAGGVLASAKSTEAKLYQYIDNKLRMINGNLSDPEFVNRKLSDGDLLIIGGLYNFVENRVLVKGHVAYPGNYEYKLGMKLSDIIEKAGILPDTNIHNAGIVRKLTNEGINFVPSDILSGKADIELRELDVITFYPEWMYRPIEILGEIKNPAVVPYYEYISLMDALHNIEFTEEVKYLKAEIYWERDYNFDALPNKVKLLIRNSMFRPKEKDIAFVTNEEEEGTIITTIPENNYVSIYLSDLLVSVTRESNIILPPGARILITKTSDIEKRPSVTLMGEIKKPGVYPRKNGNTLYDYFKHAGGYTNNAYPRGIILIRRSAKKIQEEQINMTFLSMEESLSKQSETLSLAGSSQEETLMLQFMLSKYKNSMDILKKKSQLAMGRMVLDIPMKLEELKDSPDNIELLDDDFLYIPSKPNYILVLGEVYNQLTLPYKPTGTVRYYLNQLGNVTENANEDDIYIIKSNGKIISKRQYSSLFNIHLAVDWENKRIPFTRDFYDIKLEQGDTIVVPSELKIPIMWRPILKDIAQILFQSVSTVYMMTQIF